MALDIVTLFWVLNLTYTANILFTFILYWVVGYFPGARLWMLAQILLAVGFLILALRDHLPFWAISIGNALFIEATLCYAHAAWIYRRGKRGFPTAIHASMPLIATLLFLLQGETVNLRTVIVTGALGLGCLLAFLLLVPGIAQKYRFAALVAGLPFIGIAVGSFAIAGISAFAPATEDFYELGERVGPLYLAAILTAFVFLFGFILLSTLRKQDFLEAQGAELARVNGELVAADRTKDLFMSMLAHDLRSPISGAARYARKHLIPDGVDLETKKYALHVLATSLEKSTALLDNVLLWSRSRRGEWRGARVMLDLAAEARTVISLFHPSLEDKDVKIHGAYEEARIEADRDSLQFIMRNLISNAIKFSRTGGVIEVLTGRDEGGAAFFRVSDHGVGIRPEVRERLFSIESRITTPGTSGETGTGMGLILCAEFAERDGAALEIESGPEEGTSVTVRYRR